MTPPPVQELLRQASAHYQRREIDAALRLMRQVVELEPGHAGYCNDVGLLHAARREPAQAEAWYRKAISLDPAFAVAYVNLGHALRDQARWPEAVDAYQEAARLWPASPDVHHARATALRVTGKVDEAIAAYATALRLRPNSTELHNDLGNALARRGSADEAIASFRRAIALAPGYAKPWRNLGSLLLQLGRFEQAAQALSEAERIEPGVAKTLYELGTALARSGRQEQAIVHLRQAVALDPSLGGAWCNLGLALEERGRAGEAAEALREARRLLPESSVIAYHAGALGAGEPPATCPPDYLIELFDNYADRFDDHLFNRLEYRGPQLMLDAVRAFAPREPIDVIDLGCGTGAAGPLFRPMARRLVGVDLSPRMLEKSAERGAYDELIRSDIATALRARPGGFDLALAGDVFIYVGDLADVFDAAATSLRQGGLFAFTIETVPAGDYVLRASRRYAQSLDYVGRMAAPAGFQELRSTAIVVRGGEGPAVEGAVIVLRRC